MSFPPVVSILAVIGPISITILLFTLGTLSRRLGRVTHAKPYYLGFYGAAVLMACASVVKLTALQLAQTTDLYQNNEWSILYYACFAAGVTLGLIVAWRYWSWLLAERD